MADYQGILQPGENLDGSAYLPADASTVGWGRLPRRGDAPVVTLDPGDEITIDTVSHEGLLPDQGQDPAAFFGAHGVPRSASWTTRSRSRRPARAAQRTALTW
ncbi:hypothetical protein GCM10025873_01460 [Demequina sediminis]|uniref:hypothetical protein n=1 Tax=Demequina sediminis TaxID=1930058 RepID=UPI0025738BB9|nr:hypothetical protein [Demequina sediminis]BDZ60355.1 hypothetical protein GCM10025873_01460 [Demequina sediminis]